MPEEPINLHGRDRAIALVREFTTRPEPNGYPTTRRAPILIFTGPKGCGKTALLDVLESRMRDKVPHARINCGELKSATAWTVLSLLTFDLNRSVAGYRSIPFEAAWLRVVGGFVALAVGLIAVVLGGLVLARSRRAV